MVLPRSRGGFLFFHVFIEIILTENCTNYAIISSKTRCEISDIDIPMDLYVIAVFITDVLALLNFAAM